MLIANLTVDQMSCEIDLAHCLPDMTAADDRNHRNELECIYARHFSAANIKLKYERG